jgi:hypothetical protein
MHFNELHHSVFAIIRTENQFSRVAGTAFVIRQDPILLITCYHVVSDGTNLNNGPVQYSIGKGTDEFDLLDLRSLNFSSLRIAEITSNPGIDMAILRIDPAEDPAMAQALALADVEPLPLSFSIDHRLPGAPVEWLSTAGSESLPFVPRFFRGHLVSRYRMDQHYTYLNAQGQPVKQTMAGIHLLEVDHLFIPGVSGSPLLERESSRVIGYVHAFSSWGIPTQSSFSQAVEIVDTNNQSSKVTLKNNLPMVACLSLAIDIRSAYDWLLENSFIVAQS